LNFLEKRTGLPFKGPHKLFEDDNRADWLQ